MKSKKVEVVFPDTYYGFTGSSEVLRAMKESLYDMRIKRSLVEELAKNKKYQAVVEAVLQPLSRNVNVFLTCPSGDSLQAIADLTAFCWALTFHRRMWITNTATVMKTFLLDSRSAWDDEADKELKLYRNAGLLIWKDVVEYVGGVEKHQGRIMEILKRRRESNLPVLFTSVMLGTQSAPFSKLLDKIKPMFGENIVPFIMETTEHFHHVVQLPKIKSHSV